MLVLLFVFVSFSMFDNIKNMLYVVMERGDMDLATFFRVKKSNANVRKLLVRPFWIEMVHAVHILHQHGINYSYLYTSTLLYK